MNQTWFMPWIHDTFNIFVKKEKESTSPILQRIAPHNKPICIKRYANHADKERVIYEYVALAWKIFSSISFYDTFTFRFQFCKN